MSLHLLEDFLNQLDYAEHALGKNTENEEIAETFLAGRTPEEIDRLIERASIPYALMKKLTEKQVTPAEDIPFQTMIEQVRDIQAGPDNKGFHAVVKQEDIEVDRLGLHFDYDWRAEREDFNRSAWFARTNGRVDLGKGKTLIVPRDNLRNVSRVYVELIEK